MQYAMRLGHEPAQIRLAQQRLKSFEIRALGQPNPLRITTEALTIRVARHQNLGTY